MSGNFAEVLASAARLKILQLLREVNGYSLNNQVLLSALEGMGIRLSADQLRGELAWLEQMRLITLMALGSGISVAELTERGHDVAKGSMTIPGVDRPMPGTGR